MAEYKELEKNVERIVDIYQCSECGHDFPEFSIPLYCPGCGEALD